MPVLSEYDLSGQVAILATSGGDEGPFLAQALAEAGASVFAIARHQAGLDAVLSALPAGSPSHSSGPYGAVVAWNSAEAAAPGDGGIRPATRQGRHPGKRRQEHVRGARRRDNRDRMGRNPGP